MSNNTLPKKKKKKKKLYIIYTSTSSNLSARDLTLLEKKKTSTRSVKIIKLLNMQLFVWCSPLQFFLIGLSSNLIYKLPFCMVFYKKYSCLNHRVMFILNISIIYVRKLYKSLKLQELGFLDFQTSLSP